MKKLVYPILFLFLSCKSDELDFLTPIGTENLTVEAYVNEGSNPRVYLTTGLPINGFKEIDFLKSIESTAKVEIEASSVYEIATFSKDDSRFPSRFYAFSDVIGKTGESYHLKITIGNKTYKATTKVPKKPVLKSVSVVKQSTFKEGIYNLKIEIENSKENAYYKFYVKEEKSENYEKALTFVVSNEFIKTPLLTVFNDYTDLDENEKRFSYLEKDKTFSVKIVSITKDEFLFWDRIFKSQTQLFNLPTLAQEIPTNIVDGFGFFSGNSETIRSVTIK